MSERVVVDPITRIEGHLRIEAQTDDAGSITEAYSSGTMVRGIEVILRGRDPRDALDATDDDDAGKQRHDEAVDPGIAVQKDDVLSNRVQRLTDLKGVAPAEGGTDTEDAEYDCQKLAQRS